MLGKLPESLGHALQAQRAGLDKILCNRIDLRDGTARLDVMSLAFADHGSIPMQYTADGDGTSPPLSWRGVPRGTVSLALIVEDADSPTPEPLVHAIAVDIDPQRDALANGDLMEETDASGVNLGRNSYLRQAWLPPDPPPGHGPHRYAFQVFALIAGEPFSKAPGRDELADAVRERAIASGCLIGAYERDNKIKIENTQSAAIDTAAAAQ